MSWRDGMHKIAVLSLIMIGILVGCDTAPSQELRSQRTSTERFTFDDYPQKHIPHSSEEEKSILSIQEQINDCPAGGVLMIPQGTYEEILVIDKPLTLEGYQKDTTILSVISPHNSYAICIKSPGVTIQNLTIQNSGPGLYTTGIKIVSPDTTIRHCHIQNTPVGIALWSDNNHISSCTFTGCTDEGIVLLGSAHQSVSGNKITTCHFAENCDGIELQYAVQTLISNCTFVDNTHAGIDAIREQNNKNQITKCYFENNNGYGIYLAYSQHNFIDNCTLENDDVFFNKVQNITLSHCSAESIRTTYSESVILRHCVIADQSSSSLLPAPAQTSTFAEPPENQHERTCDVLEVLQKTLTRIFSFWQKSTGMRTPIF